MSFSHSSSSQSPPPRRPKINLLIQSATNIVLHSPPRLTTPAAMFAAAVSTPVVCTCVKGRSVGERNASITRSKGRSPCIPLITMHTSNQNSRRRVSLRAGSDDPPPLSPIEQREQQVKGRRGKAKEGYFDSYPTKPSDEPQGLWETDPAAWDAKPAFEKAWSAWSGEPGMMFWMNKGSYWGAGGLAFIWVLFRLVGPALGLYQLN